MNKNTIESRRCIHRSLPEFLGFVGGVDEGVWRLRRRQVLHGVDGVGQPG